MVRAILEGRKTQTRRVVKPQPEFCGGVGEELDLSKWGSHSMDQYPHFVPVENWRCPYGQPGDRLWVKETHRFDGLDPKIALRSQCLDEISYRADMQGDRACDDCAWRPSIFMPRWASRITLEITGVRVERLNEITEEDAKKEGIEPLFTEEKIKERPDLAECRGQWSNYLWHGHFGKYGMGNAKSDRWSHQFSSYTSPVGSYSSLWESINGTGSWDANPWVWVVEFRRVEK